MLRRVEKKVEDFQLNPSKLPKNIGYSHPIFHGSKRENAEKPSLSRSRAKWYVKQALSTDDKAKLPLYVTRADHQGRIPALPLNRKNPKMLLFVYHADSKIIDVFYIHLNGRLNKELGAFSVEELSELGLPLEVFPKTANSVDPFFKKISPGMLHRFRDYHPDTHPAFSAFFSGMIKLDREHEIKMALIELVLREFARLGNPNQMKTRLAVDDDEELWIASKELPNYQNLLQYLTRKNNNILNSTAQERLKKEIQKGSCKGLGYLLITALFSSEADFKIDNLGRDAKGNLVIHDIGWGLSFLRSPLFSASKITEPLIANLPAPPLPGSVHNWFAMCANGERSSDTAFSDELKNNPTLRKEINEALLNILVLPDSLIEEFVAYYTQAIDKEFGAVLCEALLERKQALRHAAMLNPSFKNYLNAQKAIEQFSKHQAYVCQFHLTGKDQLNLPDLETLMLNEFEDLKDSVHPQKASHSSTSSTSTMLLSMPCSSHSSSSMQMSVNAETPPLPCASVAVVRPASTSASSSSYNTPSPAEPSSSTSAASSRPRITW